MTYWLSKTNSSEFGNLPLRVGRDPYLQDVWESPQVWDTGDEVMDRRELLGEKHDSFCHKSNIEFHGAELFQYW
jgi:hypothetical protein